MKVGARNQITGKVTRVKTGDIMSQVSVQMDNPAELTSVLTTDSLNDLGIKPGDNVRVVIKAIHVLLVRE